MSAVYPKAKQQFMLSALNLSSATVQAALIKSSYAYSSTDADASAIIAAHQAGASTTLANKTISASGVFDADDLNFGVVAAGSTVTAVLIYSGTIPIAYIDSGVGFPFTTSGAAVTSSFSNGGGGIFTL
jgi:hypothetical protein